MSRLGLSLISGLSKCRKLTGTSGLLRPTGTVMYKLSSINSRYLSISSSNQVNMSCPVKQDWSKTHVLAPQIGLPAPDFSGMAVVDGSFKNINKSDYNGKYVVLFFYPLDFTFVCPTEIIAFSDRVEEFRNINCEVVACSTDSHFSHLAWTQLPRKQGGLGKMDIPMLADKSTKIAQSYGIYRESDGIAFRGLFIIDGKGDLRQATINDLPVGRSVDETLRLVQAFQFVEEHGEVCPAGWKPGGDTMKPSKDGSKTYFEKANK